MTPLTPFPRGDRKDHIGLAMTILVLAVIAVFGRAAVKHWLFTTVGTPGASFIIVPVALDILIGLSWVAQIVLWSILAICNETPRPADQGVEAADEDSLRRWG